ncbi:glycosyltransferase family 2 protein [uncultured Phocaeicola sp.]|uniref:glycosyltransferase family 2 protein n=1 Tax=uncultured Phocaeicola sp. TaxID=990718 RepID=UPI00259A2A43|nr:glycosyltransferase family 2 protein [uncultured Phocaeicola sp.]
MPFLSIIVPVYNVESYLHDSLNSLLNQTFPDYEVICVNDGSTDNSLNILEEFSKKDTRIKVISQENKGLSATRNIGIRNSTGKYISFLDSDDFLKPDTYAKIYSVILENDVDTIISGYELYPEKRQVVPQIKSGYIDNYKELFSSTLKVQSSNDFCFSWRFIIKRELLIKNNIYFNELVRLGEDMIFNIEVICNSSTIYVTSFTDYCYRYNPDSLMHSKQYKPFLNQSIDLFCKIKYDQIYKYKLDNFTPYSFDLAKYTLLIYLPMLRNNLDAKKNLETYQNDLLEILSLSCIRKAFKIIGWKNIYYNYKEYLLYTLYKFRLVRILTIAHKIH